MSERKHLVWDSTFGKDADRLEWLCSEQMCARCEHSVDVSFDTDFEAGDICDNCAQILIPLLRSELEAVKEKLELSQLEYQAAVQIIAKVSEAKGAT
jgi:hypothetical protein